MWYFDPYFSVGAVVSPCRVLGSCLLNHIQPSTPEEVVTTADTLLVAPSGYPIKVEQVAGIQSSMMGHLAMAIIHPILLLQRAHHPNQGSSRATSVRRVSVHHLYMYMTSNCLKGSWRDSRPATGVRDLKLFQSSRCLSMLILQPWHHIYTRYINITDTVTSLYPHKLLCNRHNLSLLTRV